MWCKPDPVQPSSAIGVHARFYRFQMHRVVVVFDSFTSHQTQPAADGQGRGAPSLASFPGSTPKCLGVEHETPLHPQAPNVWEWSLGTGLPQLTACMVLHMTRIIVHCLRPLLSLFSGTATATASARLWHL